MATKPKYTNAGNTTINPDTGEAIDPKTGEGKGYYPGAPAGMRPIPGGGGTYAPINAPAFNPPKPKTAVPIDSPLVRPRTTIETRDPSKFYNPKAADRTLEGYQEQFNQGQQQLQSLADRQGQIGAYSDQALEKLLRGYGLKYSDDRANDEQTLNKYLEAQIQSTLKKQSKLQQLSRDLTLAGFQYQEGALGKQLDTEQTALNKLIEEQLGLNISETEQQADLVRGETGALAEDRGLLRSTFAQRAIEDVGLQEQKQIAQQRLTASEAQKAIKEYKEDTLDAIKAKRQALQNQFSLAQVKTSEDLLFNYDVTALQNELNNQLMQLQEDANDPGLFGGILGGVAGGLIGFFTGGPVGAAAGANAGFNLGSGIDQGT